MKHDGTDTLHSRTAYILSANVHRRHLTKGQQAMVTAMAYPDTEKGGRGKKINSLKIKEFEGVNSGYISQARYVLRNNFTPEGQKYPDRCLKADTHIHLNVASLEFIRMLEVNVIWVS